MVPSRLGLCLCHSAAPGRGRACLAAAASTSAAHQNVPHDLTAGPAIPAAACQKACVLRLRLWAPHSAVPGHGKLEPQQQALPTQKVGWVCSYVPCSHVPCCLATFAAAFSRQRFAQAETLLLVLQSNWVWLETAVQPLLPARASAAVATFNLSRGDCAGRCFFSCRRCSDQGHGRTRLPRPALRCSCGSAATTASRAGFGAVSACGPPPLCRACCSP